MAKAKRERTPKVHALEMRDYSLGSPELPKPTLTVTRFPELLALARTAISHFGTDENGNVPEKQRVLIEWFQTQRLPNGAPITPRLATMLTTIVGGVRKGGRPPNRKKLKP